MIFDERWILLKATLSHSDPILEPNLPILKWWNASLVQVFKRNHSIFCVFELLVLYNCIFLWYTVDQAAKIPHPTVLCSALGECNAMAIVIQLWKCGSYSGHLIWLLVAPAGVSNVTHESWETHSEHKNNLDIILEIIPNVGWKWLSSHLKAVLLRCCRAAAKLWSHFNGSESDSSSLLGTCKSTLLSLKLCQCRLLALDHTGPNNHEIIQRLETLCSSFTRFHTLNLESLIFGTSWNIWVSKSLPHRDKRASLDQPLTIVDLLLSVSGLERQE